MVSFEGLGKPETKVTDRFGEAATFRAVGLPLAWFHPPHLHLRHQPDWVSVLRPCCAGFTAYIYAYL